MRKHYFPLSMLAGCVVVVAWIAVWNYYTLMRPLAEVQKLDPIYAGVKVSAHFANYINPSVLIYDVQGISPTTPDYAVTEIFERFALRIKDQNFTLVKLAYKGKVKFHINGHDFKRIHLVSVDLSGATSDMEFLIESYFALSTLKRPDGSQAFEAPAITLNSLISKFTKDHKLFLEEWFGDDRAAEMLAQNIQPEPTFEPPAASVPIAEVQQPVAPPAEEVMIAASDPLAVAALQKNQESVVPSPTPIVASKPVVIEPPKVAVVAPESAKPAVTTKPAAPVALIVPAPVVAPSVVFALPAPPAAPAIAPPPPPVQVAVAPKEPIPIPPPAPVVKAEPVKIRIHYFRADGNYQPWSVHAWEPEMQELTGGWMNQAHFQKWDDYGAVFEIDPSRLSTKQVGFIIRRGESKDCDADREWNIGKSLEIWTVSNSCAVYYDKAKALATIRRL